MAQYCIIGDGFIAKALKKELGDKWHWYPEKDTKTIFYMGGVTHMDFERSPDFHMKQQLYEFGMLLKYCEKHQIHLIYPSSALVYEKPDSEFAKTKLAMEKHGMNHKLTLGVRMFPIYGPGENKTVISKWCRDMKAGKRPEMFGDGTQHRDFVFIDDLVWYLIDLAKNKTTGLIDIGFGYFTPFNEIIKKINNVLNTNLEPVYSPSPPGYTQGIYSDNPLPIRTTLEEGIRKICEQL